MEPGDYREVSRIYAAGIASGHATFTAGPPDTFEEFSQRFDRERWVARIDAPSSSDIVGWCATASTSSREAYAGVAEVSVYVDAAARGRRVGEQLLRAAIRASEARGTWTLQAILFPENNASQRLVAGQGFRLVGTRERIGRIPNGPLAGRWRDTQLWERRSRIAGRD